MITRSQYIKILAFCRKNGWVMQNHRIGIHSETIWADTTNLNTLKYLTTYLGCLKKNLSLGVRSPWQNWILCKTEIGIFLLRIYDVFARFALDFFLCRRESIFEVLLLQTKFTTCHTVIYSDRFLSEKDMFSYSSN